MGLGTSEVEAICQQQFHLSVVLDVKSEAHIAVLLSEG